MLNHWILVGLLFVFTYSSRIIGIELMAGRELSGTIRLYFNYVPIAIMSALIAKQILIPTDGYPTLSLPVLVGSIFTVITIKLTNKFLPSVIIGILIGLAVRSF